MSDSVGSYAGPLEACKKRNILPEIFPNWQHNAVLTAASVFCGMTLIGAAHPEGCNVENGVGKGQFQDRVWAPPGTPGLLSAEHQGTCTGDI